MKTAEQILNKIMMEETGMVNYPEKEYILQAMKEFAEQEVAKNLHKPLVSGSVCENCKILQKEAENCRKIKGNVR